MTKLQSVELKEYEIVEVDGEFERKEISSEKHPLYFTNRSLLVGKQYGILEKGLEQELFSFLAVMDPNSIKEITKGGEIETDQLLSITQLISLDHMKDIIWLAYVGAKTGECLDSEEFKALYAEDFQTVMTVYMSILTSNFENQSKQNKFKEGLNKSLSNKNKGTKK